MEEWQYWNSRAAEDSAVAYERRRPSVIRQPRVFIDGDQWCALYGESVRNGVVGFGDSPEAACTAFDEAWHEKLE